LNPRAKLTVKLSSTASVRRRCLKPANAKRKVCSMARGQNRLEVLLQGKGIYSALDILRQSKFQGQELQEMARRYPTEEHSILRQVLEVARQAKAQGQLLDPGSGNPLPNERDIPDVGGLREGHIRISVVAELEIPAAGISMPRRYVYDKPGIPTAEELERLVKERFEAAEDDKYNALRVKSMQVEYVLKGPAV